jgi:hypothetical protein
VLGARVQERRDASNRRHLHDYLATLPDWQHELCHELRELIHAAVPQIEETIKRRVRPYFILDGTICALLAGKYHINLFLYLGAIVPDPHRIIIGGHHNKAARMISFWRNSTIPANPSPPCCSTSPPTTAPVVGERSNTHRKPNPKTVWLQLSRTRHLKRHTAGAETHAVQGTPDLQPQSSGRRVSHMSLPMKCPLTGGVRQPQQFLRRARAPDPCAERASIAHCPMRR